MTRPVFSGSAKTSRQRKEIGRKHGSRPEEVLVQRGLIELQSLLERRTAHLRAELCVFWHREESPQFLEVICPEAFDILIFSVTKLAARDGIKNMPTET